MPKYFFSILIITLFILLNSCGKTPISKINPKNIVVFDQETNSLIGKLLTDGNPVSYEIGITKDDGSPISTINAQTDDVGIFEENLSEIAPEEKILKITVAKISNENTQNVEVIDSLVVENQMSIPSDVTTDDFMNVYTTIKAFNITTRKSMVLVDPDPSKYTSSYMASHADYEECGIESGRKIMARLCVWRGKSGGWWMISSLDKGRIKVSKGRISMKDFVMKGRLYHVRGFSKNEPGSTQKWPKLNWVGNSAPYKGKTYIIMDVRK